MRLPDSTDNLSHVINISICVKYEEYSKSSAQDSMSNVFFSNF